MKEGTPEGQNNPLIEPGPRLTGYLSKSECKTAVSQRASQGKESKYGVFFHVVFSEQLGKFNREIQTLCELEMVSRSS